MTQCPSSTWLDIARDVGLVLLGIAGSSLAVGVALRLVWRAIRDTFTPLG